MDFQEEVVLCGASAYTQKYYLNEKFSRLPTGIKEELQIMCVLYTEDVGGILTLVFDKEGHLRLEAQKEEDDFLYDDIGSVLKIKQIHTLKFLKS